MHKIIVGAWRDDANGPMQVVSGPVGKEKVHFEAPSAQRLKREMSAFITWTKKKSDVDPVLKSALVHLWFVTVHPFDDGNGRIARAIAVWDWRALRIAANGFTACRRKFFWNAKRITTYFKKRRNPRLT